MVRHAFLLLALVAPGPVLAELLPSPPLAPDIAALPGWQAAKILRCG
jgi:hypothetical protein